MPPEVVGYGEDGANITFMEPAPKTLRKFGGEMDEDPWELRPVGGYEMENLGVGGYPEKFYVVYRRKGLNDALRKTSMRQMWGPRDQTWIVIEKLQRDTVYEFATVPVNGKGEGPQSEWSIGLTGGIVRKYCSALVVSDGSDNIDDDADYGGNIGDDGGNIANDGGNIGDDGGNIGDDGGDIGDGGGNIGVDGGNIGDDGDNIGDDGGNIGDDGGNIGDDGGNIDNDGGNIGDDIG